MRLSSLHVSSYSCFRSGGIGFEAFTPITLIIGRNNTGKSQLLDLVELLTLKNPDQLGVKLACEGVLDEEFLEGPFSKRRSGGELSPGNGSFEERYSHFNFAGKKFLNRRVGWKMNESGQCELTKELSSDLHTQFHNVAQQTILTNLRNVPSPLLGLNYRRLLADRDIVSETAEIEMNLASNGRGATNIVRRHITSANESEALVQKTLLDALVSVFGSDGDFDQIKIRQHDAKDTDPGLWEVFLGEPRKGLVPLSKSGSGLKTVILVLLNLLVVPKILKKAEQSFVFAFEELENNLHPALLRRLFAYLAKYVEREQCMLFLTSHSNVALDFFGPRTDSQIIHVTHDGATALAKTVKAHFDQVGLLTELGSRPSDLLQANGVVWLEGPSDRIYFNRFIELYSRGELREGRHYQCAFYGGSLLAKSAFREPGHDDRTFANLLRLNSNIAVVCDGDKTAATGKGSRIKVRVRRIKEEIDKIPGAFLWITTAKEIENYVPGVVWAIVYGEPKVPDPSRFDSFPGSGLKATNFVQRYLRRKSFDKCEFAMEAAPHLTVEALNSRFEFENQIRLLVKAIRAWNR